MTTSVKTLVDNTKGLKFTESPRWYNGKLWFIDIHDKRIKSVDLSGTVATEVELPFIPNAFGLTPDGTVVVGDAFQRKIYRRTGGSLEQVADISKLTRFCLSDGIVDAKGRMYVGDIGYNFNDPVARPVDTCGRSHSF
jgi:sugar lactone lactonase YvrE